MNGQELIRALQLEHAEVFRSPTLDQKRLLAFRQKLEQLTNMNPDNPALLFQLGTLCMQMDQAACAIALLHRAMKAGPKGEGVKGAPPWLNMASAYKVEHLDDRAEECYKLAAAAARRFPNTDSRGINVDESHAFHGLASLYVNRGDPWTGIEFAKRALQIDPEDRFAHWNKGIMELEAGNWAEGFKEYHEAGFKTSNYKPTERKLKEYGGIPEWDGTPGKTVICYGEQGVGDEVMFASMLPDLMKICKVIIDCDGRLLTMFKESFPDAEAVYPTSGLNDPFPWVKGHKIDARLAMGSLGYFFRKKSEDFPKTAYIKPLPDKLKKWADILHDHDGGAKFRVGISWAGGLKKTRADMRTIPLPMWEEVLTVPGVEWYSLQYQNQEAADEVANMSAKLGVTINHWGDVAGNWPELNGFLPNLDLLITVNTSIHHLAGGMGVKQWCLTPKYAAWRYGVQGESPWYGNCTMYRQELPREAVVHPGDSKPWEPVMKRVASDLRALVGGKS